MHVLVTGGLGYIGSHTVVELIEHGYQVVIVDDLSNASLDTLEGIEKITGVRPVFEQVDLKCTASVEALFKAYPKIDTVMHFAASKAIGESFENPLLYYQNNLFSLINVLQGIALKQRPTLIFSSSCTVYGQGAVMPIVETDPIQPALSPYGNTKQISEQIIVDLAQSSSLKAIMLRYFNPIGAHDSICIGEYPLGVPQNLIPYITQTAVGIREELAVFGTDFDTPDGSCIRDYIHVMDLAKAHLLALKRLESIKDTPKIEVFNVGQGTGTSVLEIIETFEGISGLKLPFKVVGRRQGDVARAYADTTKAREVLGFTPKKTLAQSLKSAWQWQLSLQAKQKSKA